MSRFFLLPGSDGDVGVWQDVCRELLREGHEAIPVSLAAPGKPVTPGLAAQMALVENSMKLFAKPPLRTVLVGYGYSGLVAGGVARGYNPPGSLIYVDAIVPEVTISVRREEILSDLAITLLGPGSGPRLAAPEPAVPTAYILCTGRPQKPVYRPVDLSADHARRRRWLWGELRAGHRPMTEQPKKLTSLLVELAQELEIRGPGPAPGGTLR